MPRAPSNKVYELPPEVMAALASDRPELIVGLKKALLSGVRSLTPQVIAGLLELLQDLMIDRTERARELNEATRLLDQVDGLCKGIMKSAGEAHMMVERAKE